MFVRYSFCFQGPAGEEDQRNTVCVRYIVIYRSLLIVGYIMLADGNYNLVYGPEGLLIDSRPNLEINVVGFNRHAGTTKQR